MRPQLVPLATFGTLEEAEPLRQFLLAAGLPVVVAKNSSRASRISGLDRSFDPIFVLVPEAFRDQALTILEQQGPSGGPDTASRPTTTVAEDHWRHEELVPLALLEPAFASALVGQLEEAGIRATIYEQENLVPWVPVAFGKVRVVVLEGDLERALAVLYEFEAQAVPSEEPHSTHVQVSVATLRSSTEASRGALSTAVVGKTVPDTETGVRSARPPLDLRSPPSPAEVALRDYSLSLRPCPKRDARQAFRAALQGCFLFPPILHFYSAGLVGRILWSGGWGQLDILGKAYFLAACVLDLIVLSAALVLFAILMR